MSTISFTFCDICNQVNNANRARGVFIGDDPTKWGWMAIESAWFVSTHEYDCDSIAHVCPHCIQEREFRHFESSKTEQDFFGE